jgi:hypothetical protein
VVDIYRTKADKRRNVMAVGCACLCGVALIFWSAHTRAQDRQDVETAGVEAFEGTAPVDIIDGAVPVVVIETSGDKVAVRSAPYAEAVDESQRVETVIGRVAGDFTFAVYGDARLVEGRADYETGGNGSWVCFNWEDVKYGDRDALGVDSGEAARSGIGCINTRYAEVINVESASPE